MVTDVEELPSHGGSLRVFAQRADGPHTVGTAVARVLGEERAAGVDTPGYYDGFAAGVRRVTTDLLRFLFDAAEEGRQVVGYGAPGKGMTLLNHAGIRSDLLGYLVDRNPAKQGMLAPGCRIPIHHPDRIEQTRPDVILVMPWNLSTEIAEQLAYVKGWGARLMVAIPELTELP